MRTWCSMPKTILLIDDEEHFLMAISARLSASGYDVITAPDGIEGLRIASECIPDAVVCDVNMPRIDGLETLRRLRKITGCASVPVIFLSANVQPRNRARAFECGACCYLSKPCESKKLLSALDAAISDAGSPASSIDRSYAFPA